MSQKKMTESEAAALWLMANDGTATEEQLSDLSHALESCPKLCEHVVELAGQQAWLSWRGADDASPSRSAPKPGEPIDHAPAQRGDARPRRRSPLSGLGSLPFGASTVTAFASGAALALAVGWFAWRADSRIGAPAADAMGARSPFVTRVVSTAGCLWDPSTGPQLSSGQLLESGQTVQVLEGLARFRVDWLSGNADYLLEGPAAAIQTSDGLLALRFGKLMLKSEHDLRGFALETPIGRVTPIGASEIGVSASGQDVGVHVFEGAAWIETPWPSEQDRTRIEVAKGDAVQFTAGPDGSVDFHRVAATSSLFAARQSMAADRLDVPQAYVDAVLESAPSMFWRFSEMHGETVRNEVGDQLHGHLEGPVSRAISGANTVIDLGGGDEIGLVVSDGPVSSRPLDDYTFEVWMKPSHFHTGTILCLHDPDGPLLPPHVGFSLELEGLFRMSPVFKRKSIRFLHRSPPDEQGGFSILSEEAYSLRQWQHVVAVKEGDELRLYVDGVEQSRGLGPDALPAGMRLLIGDTYPTQPYRPFIGQVDEFAFYERALLPAEISAHFKAMSAKPRDASASSVAY